MPLFIPSLEDPPTDSNTDFEVRIVDPDLQSSGYRRSIDLPCGINILIDRYDLSENLVVEAKSGNDLAVLEFSFMVKGDNSTEIIPAGKNFVNSYFDEYTPDNTFYWQAGQQILKIDIEVSADFYRSPLVNSLAALPSSFHRYLETDNIKFLEYFQVGQTTPAMQVILNRILDCPFAGLTRQIYLEAKSLELIELRLAPTSSIERGSVYPRRLKASDIDRIYHARDILLSHHSRPPSLLELAQKVNLNDYKLKAGFRQIFGTTVFGYLWAYRMERARQLLSCPQLTVQDIAFEVGYTCHGRFSAAFRRRFNSTPTDYQSWCRKRSVSA
jgi:AraC family transcriptional regulator, transcriptional activator of the genes for pyochelin and ferripyochelin receptors